MEVTYIANGSPKESSFLRTGWAPRDNVGVEYDLAFGAGRADDFTG